MTKRKHNRPQAGSRPAARNSTPSRKGAGLAVILVLVGLGVTAIFIFKPGGKSRPAASHASAVTNAPTASLPVPAPAAPEVPPPDRGSSAGTSPAVQEGPIANLDTNSVSDMLNLGNFMLQQNELAEAEKAYRRAVEINPDDEDAHFNLGIALARQQKFEEAIKEYYETLAIFPDYLEAKQNIANSLIKLERTDEAIKVLEEAIQVNPDYVPALNNLGRLQAVKRNWPRAIELLERAAGIDSMDFEVQFNLGNARWQQGDKAGAIKTFETALELRPNDVLALSMLAQALVSDGQTERALTQLTQALPGNPDSPELLYNLGQLNARLGRPAEAARYFERVTQLAPDFAPARQALERARAEAAGTSPPPDLKSPP